jgi:hypothetical protein
MKGFDIDKIEEIDNGGKTQEQLLTGEYLTQVNPKSGMQPNAEVEGEEYVQFPDKETQKVAGPTHEQGGVPVVLPDETKILSKTLKLTKQQAKSLSSLFDVEVTEKDSYASALDKYTKKIGLTKLNQEQEEVFSTLKKQAEKKDINIKTQKINQDFLSKKIHGIEQRKQPLEQERAKMFDVLFEAQEKTKAESGDQEAMFRYGGIQKSNFEATAKKLGLDPTQAAMMLRSKREANLNFYEKGGQTGDKPSIFVSDQSAIFTGAKLDDSQKEKLIAYYEKHNKELAAFLKEDPKRWNSFVFNRGLVEDLNNTDVNSIKTGKQGLDRNKNFLPKAGTYGDMTQGRVDGFTLKDYYEATTGKNFADITRPEVKQLQEQYNRDIQSRRSINYYSGVAGSTGTAPVSDELFGNRTASYVRENVTVKGKKEGTIDVDALIRGKYTDDELNDILKDYGLKASDLADFKNSAVKYITISPDAPQDIKDIKVPPPTTEGPADPLATGTPIEDRVGQAPGREYPRLFYTPDQSVLPPTPPEAHLKANNRLQRIDPVRIGIEQTIQETANQRNFVADQIQNLPESQRAAVLANLMATSQNTISQAATQANVVNAQNESQAELFNIQQAGQEGMMETNNALDFERRQFTAKAKADEQLRNYYDYNRKVNVTNFQNMQKLNLLDSLFPDFDLDFFGASVNYNPKSEWAPVVDNMPQQTSAQEPMSKDEMMYKREQMRLRQAELALAKQRQKAQQQGLFFDMYGNTMGW